MFSIVIALLKFSPILLVLLLFSPQFGGRLRKRHKQKYAHSKNWKGTIFENLTETTMDVNLKTMPGLIRAQFKDRQLRMPEKPIPIIPFDETKWNAEPEKPKFIWYGHSVLLLQLNGKNLLIDPMLGSDASPIAPIKTKRFSENSIDVIDQLPKIDAVLFTHDHYDHIDLKSVRKLMPKVDKWFVGLGIGRHLERWKIPSDQITEFDWWQEMEFEGIKIAYTPSRHFSGRGPFDRAQSLWGGWVFIAEKHRVYWSGDGGYQHHFKEVGVKYGPFDWGFMENGQYNELWHAIHMYPEEAVQAANDAKVNVAIPVHWAGFALALHPWKESIERFTREAEAKNQNISTPQIGEITIFESEPSTCWWEPLK
ncbi:MAG: MBL fold metallo-hydrolase [Flavobacteriales bacterium]|nr:MBL fold metallo-hydrolase [Flavobacteriales bacterium]